MLDRLSLLRVPSPAGFVASVRIVAAASCRVHFGIPLRNAMRASEDTSALAQTVEGCATDSLTDPVKPLVAFICGLLPRPCIESKAGGTRRLSIEVIEILRLAQVCGSVQRPPSDPGARPRRAPGGDPPGAGSF